MARKKDEIKMLPHSPLPPRLKLTPLVPDPPPPTDRPGGRRAWGAGPAPYTSFPLTLRPCSSPSPPSPQDISAPATHAPPQGWQGSFSHFFPQSWAAFCPSLHPFSRGRPQCHWQARLWLLWGAEEPAGTGAGQLLTSPQRPRSPPPAPGHRHPTHQAKYRL